MKKIFIYLLLPAVVILSLISCDATNQPEDLSEEIPVISGMEILPSNVITFDRQNDGLKDTTLNIELRASVDNLGGEAPSFSVTDAYTRETLQEGQLETDGNFYSAELSFETTTTSLAEYTINVFAYNSYGNGTYAQSRFEIKGFPNNPPQVLSVNFPPEVEIPNDNTQVLVDFEARVTDADGQDNVANVYMNFRNEDGSLVRIQPFEMLDDGSEGNSNSGDEMASDSVYTVRFQIDSSSNPGNRTAIFWAEDRTGLSSDTLTAPFNLVDNE